MENFDIIVGLDIGTTKIATIVGRRNEHGKIEILGYGKSESLGVTRVVFFLPSAGADVIEPILDRYAEEFLAKV